MENHKTPEKILQFGKGNFLRGFFDWQIEKMKRAGVYGGSIVIYQPSPNGSVPDFLQEQNYQFYVAERGLSEQKKVDQELLITTISRTFAYNEWQEILQLAESDELECIVSNTTEAGIVYKECEPPAENDIPLSFPAKLTEFLSRRFSVKGKSEAPGLIILPCELVEQNGEMLKGIILQHAADWELPKEFTAWINENIHFCNTLVDRIVTGYSEEKAAKIEEKTNFKDHWLVVTEPYYSFVIDGPAEVKEKLPFQKAGLSVTWDKTESYREMKVRLLNGPHTMMCASGLVHGLKTVQEVMKNPLFGTFVENGMEEIRSVLTLDKKKTADFRDQVLDRFQNPFNPHQLADIARYSITKFRVRLLPVVKSYLEVHGTPPKRITFSMASVLRYYRPVKVENDEFFGEYKGMEYKLFESKEVLGRLSDAWQEDDKNKRTAMLLSKEIWGEELEELKDLLPSYLELIEKMAKAKF
ncbi:tagaturonate reductase [Alkalicoccus daliensis]|uniref:Tagaturonate reductase n=1 Tax=Alkalicoccus daliensis TaxID=745820 RepID=A0A1H0EYV1_9BACI|nr:tagaturonate reductase [Alkalicoccus daliensis]SDN87513.1 tagaturonate reductase [Alkalicoccus daliensis]